MLPRSGFGVRRESGERLTRTGVTSKLRKLTAAAALSGRVTTVPRFLVCPKGATRLGLLPHDIADGGKKEFPFPRDNYRFKYPPSAAQIAAERKTGYAVVLKSFRAILNFLQGGQGAVVIGGPWGGFTPDERGICRRYRAGTKGHARAYVDWVTIDGALMLDEANSHFLDYGDEGHAYHTEEFVNGQCADRSFVAIGISDITLSQGDKPKQRKIPRYVKLSGVSATS